MNDNDTAMKALVDMYDNLERDLLRLLATMPEDTLDKIRKAVSKPVIVAVDINEEEFKKEMAEHQPLLPYDNGWNYDMGALPKDKLVIACRVYPSGHSYMAVVHSKQVRIECDLEHLPYVWYAWKLAPKIAVLSDATG